MQDTRTNRLENVSPELRKMFQDGGPTTEEELRKRIDATGKIVTADQGPIFVEGEIYPIQGYNYRLERIKRNGLVFKPHGPIEI